MRMFTKYSPVKISTANGYTLEVTTVFSSFDESEVKAVEEQCKQSIGDGVVQNVEVPTDALKRGIV